MTSPQRGKDGGTTNCKLGWFSRLKRGDNGREGVKKNLKMGCLHLWMPLCKNIFNIHHSFISLVKNNCLIFENIKFIDNWYSPTSVWNSKTVISLLYGKQALILFDFLQRKYVGNALICQILTVSRETLGHNICHNMHFLRYSHFKNLPFDYVCLFIISLGSIRFAGTS